MSDDIFSDEKTTEAPSANKGAPAKASKSRKTSTPKHDPKKEVALVDVLAHYTGSGMSGITMAEAVLMLDQGRRAGWDLQIRSGFVTGDGDVFDPKVALRRNRPRRPAFVSSRRPTPFASPTPCKSGTSSYRRAPRRRSISSEVGGLGCLSSRGSASVPRTHMQPW